MSKPKPRIIHCGSGLSYLTLAQAMVKITDSKDIFANPDAKPIGSPLGEKFPDIVPWGSDNDLPQQIITKVSKSPDMSTNMLFNIASGYGEGVVPVRRVFENGKTTIVPVNDNQEINDFFENNDISGYLLEQLTDLNYFYMSFPEIILNRESSEKRRVVELCSKDAAFSRWGVMKMDNQVEYPDNAPGTIEYHYYSAVWADRTPKVEELVATRVLSFKNPVLDLKRRIGREPWPDLKINDENVFRYIIPVEFPTPGRFYYQKPYWYSLIESGWYDFATMIPEFKKALLTNQMTIKYMVYISDQYFTSLFAEEGINDDVKKRARIKQEYDNIQNFLAGAKNTGKATISKIKYSPDGKEHPMIKIIPIENHFKGGEYIEDSEEVSNILAYGMGVHASLIGSHGKAKTISGTETRELFIIKQALLKPIRDRLLRPFYVIKAINKWPADIYFAIPNLELTTLDKGTGAQKVISQPAT